MVRSMGKPEYRHRDLTKQIIDDVYNLLGYGFLEKVYENSLALRLRRSGLAVQQQLPISVYFDGEIVGQYFADVVVNDTVLLEIKATATTSADHHAQLVNYLKATQYEIGLLLNFGIEPKVVRKAFDNHRKRLLRKQR